MTTDHDPVRPLNADELADLRALMAQPGHEGNPGGSGKGFGWPWGSPGSEELVRRLLATLDAPPAPTSTTPAQEYRDALPEAAVPPLLEAKRALNRAISAVLAEERRVHPRVQPNPLYDEFTRLHLVEQQLDEALYPVADRGWHVRARVRMRREHRCGSVDPMLTTVFRAGEEYTLIQWGVAGRLVLREAWWTSTDIDGAFIVPSDAVEVIEVLDERSPFGETDDA